MKLCRKVMVGELPKLCLLVATLAVGHVGAACERGRTWWDRARGECAHCTKCEPLLAVKVPCELHRDTICQPLHEINIDITTDNDNDEQFSEIEYYDDYYGEVDESDVWNVQATTLTLSLAICGCVLFFIVVLYLTFYHSKQWKVLKQALKSDVQDLSAKLKLMEAGETPAEPVTPIDHHIYCNIHIAKNAILGPTSDKKRLGNVYTQEKHST